MRKNLISVFLLSSLFSYSQDSTKQLNDTAMARYRLEKMPDSERTNAFQETASPTGANYKGRKWTVGVGTAAVYGSSFIYLNEAWYKDYPRSSFHSFNDAGEWMQVDKAGHAWTAYTMGRITTALWKWAGVNDKKAVYLGSGTSLLYLLSIEYLDGRSAEWGWSWADVAADFSGAALFSVQELLWKQQKIQFKFSSHRINYESDLTERANDLFGLSLNERLLKDYNAQTYWLSFNIKSFLRNHNFPKWLNLSIGCGAGGMLGGYENIAYDKNGNVTFDRSDIPRYRQWYIAPDVDLTKIKTKSKFLKTVFFALNSFKFPSPSLELSSGKIKGHWLQF